MIDGTMTSDVYHPRKRVTGRVTDVPACNAEARTRPLSTTSGTSARGVTTLSGTDGQATVTNRTVFVTNCEIWSSTCEVAMAIDTRARLNR